MAALTALMFEERLNHYLYERAEEARAVRVGEKETSEQAAIVARYASLFTRDQHAALKGAEAQDGSRPDERLARLRDACEGGIVMGELAESLDALENAILACRVAHDGEELPLRAAQAALAVEARRGFDHGVAEAVAAGVVVDHCERGLGSP